MPCAALPTLPHAFPLHKSIDDCAKCVLGLIQLRYTVRVISFLYQLCPFHLPELSLCSWLDYAQISMKFAEIGVENIIV